MKLAIHVQGDTFFIEIAARSKIVQLIALLRHELPEFFKDRQFNLCKNKNGSGKLKTTDTLSTIILSDSPPQYHPTEECSILYVKYKNTSSIWGKIKGSFKKNL
jgi:hypothetical protein